MPKIAITGLPNSGKTTLANTLGLDVIHTDDFIEKYDFSEVPLRVIETLADRESYVVEGVQVARMLRLGDRKGIWKPDAIIFMSGGDVDNPISNMVRASFDDFIAETGANFYTMGFKPKMTTDGKRKPPRAKRKAKPKEKKVFPSRMFVG